MVFGPGRMPFGALTFQLAFFLCLVQVLASLPTDPYFRSWREELPSQRISRYPQGLGEGMGREVPGRRNLSRGPGGAGAGAGARVYEHEFDRRGGNPRDKGRGLGIYPQGGFGNGGQLFQVRSLEDVTSEVYLSAGGYENEPISPPNFGNSYSSHVKCRVESRHGGMTEKTWKNIGTNTEVIFGWEGAGKADERINFEEASRNMRSGTSKEMDVPNPRIVTPKGGRRPSQGSSAKNENKPSNAISTTEKALGNQTAKGPKRSRPGAAKPPGGDIVFPDGYPKKFVPRVTKCAKKSTFCEHLGEEYPGDYISQVLKKEGVMFKEFFGKDVISDPNITERINAPEENSLCPYRQEVVFPRAAQNKEDKWLFIVNQDQYVQGVTVEVCLNPESRCILTEGFPLGYTPYCKQKYIERRLVAIGEDGKPHSDSFRLPSCCSCVVKHETSARMAPVRSSRGFDVPLSSRTLLP